MVTPTWHDRERRILEHIVQAWEDGRRAEVDDIALAVDLDHGQAVRVVGALHRDGYVTGVEVGAEDPDLIALIEPTPKARRAVGQWPTLGGELYDGLIAALDERITNESDERQRTRLQRARSALADVGRDVVASALVEAVKLGTGLGG